MRNDGGPPDRVEGNKMTEPVRLKASIRWTRRGLGVSGNHTILSESWGGG